MAARCAELRMSFCSMAPLTPLSPPGAAGLVGLIVWAPAFDAPRQQPSSAAASVTENVPRYFIDCSLLLRLVRKPARCSQHVASFLPQLLTRWLSRYGLHGDVGYRINDQDAIGFVDITIDDRLRCYRSDDSRSRDDWRRRHDGRRNVVNRSRVAVA